MATAFRLSHLLLGALTALSACGDDTPPTRTPPLHGLFEGVTPTTARGSIDLDSFGGHAAVVVSAHAPPATIDDAGGFTTAVSDIGAQVLFVVDADEAPRGLLLSAPGTTGSTAPTALRGDAETTALGLLFLVPGLGTSDPDEAPGVIAELRAMPTFDALVDHLAGALPSAPLTALNEAEGELEALTVAVVDAWLVDHPLTELAPAALTFAGPSDGSGLRVHTPDPAGLGGRDVAVDLVDQDGASPSVAIQNRSWRYLDVHRVVHPGGQPVALTSCPKGLLDGVRGASWGTLFYGGFAQPTRTMQDQIALGDALWVEYWFRGPGLQLPQHSPPLPEGLVRVEPCAWVTSTFMYVALPALSIIGGLGKALSLQGLSVDALRSDLWVLVREGTRGRTITKALDTMGAKVGSGDDTGFRRAAVDLGAAVIGGVALIAGTEGAVGLGVAAAGYLAPALTLGSGLMAAGNVGMAVSRWVGLPAYSVQYVARPLYGYTVEASPTSARADGEDAVAVTVDVGRYGFTQDPHLDFLATPAATPSGPADRPMELTLRALRVPDGENGATFGESGSPTWTFTTFASGGSPSGSLTSTEPGSYELALDDAYDDLVAAGAKASVEFREVDWDVTRDWSATANPNGAWSLGWAPSPGGPFTAFGVGFEAECGYVWGGFGRLQTPSIWRNECGATRDGVAPGQVSLHPGCDANELATVRWTAPSEGTFDVELAWFAGDHGGPDWPSYAGETDAYVAHNGAVIASFPDTEGGPTWRQTVTVAAGDTLDFAVGTKGHCLYDNTPLELVIRPE